MSIAEGHADAAWTSAMQLGAFVAEHRASALPATVDARVAECFPDSVGCAIGGTTVREVRLTVDLAMERGGPAEAVVPGIGMAIPATDATYAGAMLANALDFDDTVLGLGHPAATVVPTALAFAQLVAADGRDLVRAILCGYEVSLRIARATAPTPARARRVRGFSWQTFGAAAAAASLLRLDAERAAHARALAAVHAPVPFVATWYQRPILWVKNNYGRTARAGAWAAMLAERGVRANPRVLDVRFKPYPACRYLHPALDALRDLLTERPTLSQEIRIMHVRAASKIGVFDDGEPTTVIDAQFSAPLQVAAMLLGRPADEAALHDPAVRALAERVRVEVEDGAEPGLAPLLTMVSVKLLDGTRLERRVEAPRGDSARPMARSALEAKFHALAAPVVGDHHAGRIVAAARDLATLDEVRTLARWMVP